MQGMYSMRSPAVKRLMKEAQELSQPTEQYFAQPLEDNLFEWHFTLRGPGESEFDGGLYHGRIILPPDYPMKPPSIILLTPNGRFETNKKICLSISGHHPESWQPSWSIRTALLAIIGFMPTHGAGAIGSLDYSSEERKKLAKRSKDWKCPTCGNINNILKPVTEASEKTTQEAKELASQINFQGEKEKSKESTSDQNSSTPDTPETTQTPVSTQSAPPQQSPQAFPQYQFSRFPFPSPFMQFPGMPQYNQSGNNSVPRFPPPPPFIPAMFPPYMSGAGQGGPNTGMFMSYYQNMYNSQTQSSNSTSSSTTTTTTTPSATPTTTPSSSVTPTTTPRASVTPTARATPSSTLTTATTSAETNIPTSTRKEPAIVPKTKSIRTEQTSDSVKTQTESIVSTENTTSDGISNESVTDETSDRNTEIQNTSSDNNITGTEGTSVRQRAPATSAPQSSVPTGIHRPAGTVGQSAELRPSRRTFSTFLILVISLAIAILLIRRFILSRNWKFHYGM